MDDQQAFQKLEQLSPPPAQQPGGPHVATAEESLQELTEAIKGSNQVLTQGTTVLSLFPDTVAVDRAKLTVTHRSFIRTSEVVSIRIEDILNVTAAIGPLFGSIKITNRVMSPEEPYVIGPFWRADATRLKRVTQGYVIALQRGIDCSSLPTAALADLLDQLGEDEHAV